MAPVYAWAASTCQSISVVELRIIPFFLEGSHILQNVEAKGVALFGRVDGRTAAVSFRNSLDHRESKTPPFLPARFSRTSASIGLEQHSAFFFRDRLTEVVHGNDDPSFFFEEPDIYGRAGKSVLQCIVQQVVDSAREMVPAPMTAHRPNGV